MDKKKRWTLGVVLVAAVGLFGLVEAGASPFSTQLLSDDLGNAVRGEAPRAMGTQDNNGHGNNEDGVDSSNKGQGNGGPTGGADESCDGSGDCVDDESGGGKGKGKNK